MKRSDFVKIIGGGSTALLFTGAIDTSQKLMFEKKSIKIYDNYIKGLNYYDWEKVFKQIKKSDNITLKRDLDNIHDTFATSIHWKENKLGYIPAFENITLANLIDNGVELQSSVSFISHTAKDKPYYLESLAIEMFADLLVPINHIKTKELTNKRADDIEDVYRNNLY